VFDAVVLLHRHDRQSESDIGGCRTCGTLPSAPPLVELMSTELNSLTVERNLFEVNKKYMSQREYHECMMRIQ
jgi:hypothetical protein